MKETAAKLERRCTLGTRPFRSPAEQAELDEPPKVSSQTEWLVQAIHLIHHALTVFVKQCYLESAYDAVERTRSGIEKKAWYSKVEDLWEEASKRDDVSELGLEQPMFKEMNRELFLQKAEERYGRVIRHVYKDEKARKDEKTKRAEDEKILEQKIEASSPDVLIKDDIDVKCWRDREDERRGRTRRCPHQ